MTSTFARLPLVVLVTCQAGFLACLAITYSRLPAEIASHFNAQGVPNGWASRMTYAAAMTCVVLVSSSLMAGLFYSVRFIPNRLINLPNRDYWLAPGRREATVEHLFRIGALIGAMEALFFAGVHLLVVLANASDPPRLSTALWPLTVVFLLAIAGCIATLVWRFRKPQVD